MAITRLPSASITGTLAKARFPSGTIIQEVSNSSTTGLTTSSTSFVKAPLDVTITPSSSSSKIYISAQGMMNSFRSNQWIYYSLYRGTTTNLGTSGVGLGGHYSDHDSHTPAVIAMVDSPATTSAITYSIYVRITGSETHRWNPDGHTINIVAMELAG